MRCCKALHLSFVVAAGAHLPAHLHHHNRHHYQDQQQQQQQRLFHYDDHAALLQSYAEPNIEAGFTHYQQSGGYNCDSTSSRLRFD